jgi:hypothetical protein
MKPHRRALLKGMMAGSAIIAAGLPKISFAKEKAPAARDVVLVSCGRPAAGFAAGAGVAARRDLGAGSLPDLAATRALFESCRGARLVGLMEDAAFVLFSEMARDAGARLVFEGQHSIAAAGRQSRHAFISAAGFHGSAESLVAALTAADAAFVIAETPVGGGGRIVRGGDWSRLGFESFHVADETPAWLHLSGVSRQEGCDALGVAAVQTEPLRCWPTYVPEAPAGAGWSAILGNTLARLAAGGEENRQPCLRQVFVRGAEALDEFATQDSYVSFVMEA